MSLSGGRRAVALGLAHAGSRRVVHSSDAIGQTRRLTERDEVAPLEHFYVQAEPGARDRALKLEREQPVVAA